MECPYTLIQGKEGAKRWNPAPRRWGQKSTGARGVCCSSGTLDGNGARIDSANTTRVLCGIVLSMIDFFAK